MQDLSALGLLSAPHTSSGRMPTHQGLRLFVDGLLEVGDVAEDAKREIEARLTGHGQSFDAALREAFEPFVRPGRWRRPGHDPVL